MLIENFGGRKMTKVQETASEYIEALKENLDGDSKKIDELLNSEIPVEVLQGKSFGEQVSEAQGNPEFLQRLADGAEDAFRSILHGGKKKFKKPIIKSGFGSRHPADLERNFIEPGEAA